MLGGRHDLHHNQVEYLPYPSGMFETIVNTMAFSVYPDGCKAMIEVSRVLNHTGRPVMVNVNENWLGTKIARIWESSEDIWGSILY